MGKKRKPQYGPKDFLAELDITPADDDNAWRAKLWEMLAEEGIDLERLNKPSWTDPAYMDLYFTTPKIAKHSLRNEYRRYRKTMQWLLDHKSSLGGPKQILDIGCGAGLLTLWLAKLFPDSSVIGMDMSRKSIDTAVAYAKLLGITNAAFRVVSFEELASDSTLRGKCDLFFSARALSVAIPPDAHLDGEEERIEFGKVFAFSQLSEDQLQVLCSETITPYCNALNQLSSVNATVVITEELKGRLLLWALCYGMQQTRFGIDWSISQEADHEDYLVLRQGLSRCGMPHGDWALAYSALGSEANNDGKIHEGLAESYIRVFDHYPSSRCLQLQWHSGGTERLRMKIVSGILVFERTTTLGYREFQVHSLCSLERVLTTIEQVLQNFSDKQQGDVVINEWKPELLKYIESVHCYSAAAIAHAEIPPS